MDATSKCIPGKHRQIISLSYSLSFSFFRFRPFSPPYFRIFSSLSLPIFRISLSFLSMFIFLSPLCIDISFFSHFFFSVAFYSFPSLLFIYSLCLTCMFPRSYKDKRTQDNRLKRANLKYSYYVRLYSLYSLYSIRSSYLFSG